MSNPTAIVRTNAQNISSSRRALNPDEVKKRLRKEYQEKRREMKMAQKEATEVMKDRLHSMGMDDKHIEHPAEGPGLGTSEVSNFHKGKIIHHDNVASTGYLMLLDSGPVQDTASGPASIYTGGSTPRHSRGSLSAATPRKHLPCAYRRAFQRYCSAPSDVSKMYS